MLNAKAKALSDDLQNKIGGKLISVRYCGGQSASGQQSGFLQVLVDDDNPSSFGIQDECEGMRVVVTSGKEGSLDGK